MSRKQLLCQDYEICSDKNCNRRGKIKSDNWKKRSYIGCQSYRELRTYPSKRKYQIGGLENELETNSN